MAGILALDLSKASTGWAFWDRQSERPQFGSWRLGSEYTSDGGTFAKLHQNLAELHQVMRYEAMYYEQKIDPAKMGGHTSIAAINIMSGLEAHAKSFAYAYRLRTCKAVSINHWRGSFLGRMEVADARAAARAARKAGNERASAREDLKALTIARCRVLGFMVKNDDEADAIGILDYACELSGLTPPWRADEVLRPALGMR